jgi:hypothetical protein
MYYVNGKQVKEMLMKGSDGFLHKILYGYLNNRKFYSKNSSYESPLVNVCVYCEGERLLTNPQFIKRSELSSTTITIQNTFQYDLKVSNPSVSGVTNFSGTKGKRPTFKLDPAIIGTKSNVNIYLLKVSESTSDWTDTGSYSIILDDYSFTSIPTSALHKDCGFENAAAYVRDSDNVYNLCYVSGIGILPAPGHETFAYVSLNLVNPPEISFSGSQSLIHFGYLPKDTAEAMGFTATENPNGIQKEATDYYGWGCWADNEQWFWSDDELREIFSSGPGTINQMFLDSLVTNSTLTYTDTWHWGVYDLDISSLGGNASFIYNPVFSDGWIFDHDDTQMFSDIISLQNTTLADVLNAYFTSPQGTITIIIPYSQQSTNSNDTMGNLWGELEGNLIITTDIFTCAEQFFNVDTNAKPLPTNNFVTGTFKTSISSTDGYLYCCSNFGSSDMLTATASNVVTFNVGSDTSIVYLGARNKNADLNLDFSDPSVPSSLVEIFNSERFSYYKLLPFITGQNDGSISTDGTIESWL